MTVSICGAGGTCGVTTYKKLKRRRELLRASRVVGTGALHQSLHGSCHRSSGTDLSSGIMAAPPVITAATLASTTSSVYERVAQTTVAWQNVSPWTQGRIPSVH